MATNSSSETALQKFLFYLPAVIIGFFSWRMEWWEDKSWWTELGYSVLLGVITFFVGMFAFVMLASFIGKWYTGNEPVETVNYLMKTRKDILISALTFGAIIWVWLQYSKSEEIGQLADCVDDYASEMLERQPSVLLEICRERESADYY